MVELPPELLLEELELLEDELLEELELLEEESSSEGDEPPQAVKMPHTNSVNNTCYYVYLGDA